MEKHQISDSFYYARTRDRVGGTIRTEVFKLENGIFKAFSSYSQDEDEKIVGFAQSCNDEEAVKLSRKALRKEWKA
ncbi:hypothetical protein [Neobacillus massiliamazoniensis]|uniref:Uncharacterized protein n=1 Tax=Neobacillus massiliamazoniensis TaxID=1499688 RepID=A0A0U1NYB1_9BACI|nr:hypothetical protein [Neobacillus massiliamazoniensis]CRK83001.1 hypothetical protein BN000_02956 [Neobacillus massiliamazoniensis]